MDPKRNRTLLAAVLLALFLCLPLSVTAQEADPLPPSDPLTSTEPIPGNSEPPIEVEAPNTDTPTEPPPTESDSTDDSTTPPTLLQPPSEVEDETTPIEPEEPVTPEADMVATWDELALWMTTHAKEGGSVRLSASIVCPTEGANFFFLSATTIDLGEHSLTVTGSLELYSPYLTIKGAGGADASLRVSPGGYLSVTAYAVEPGANGPTLWQDEGGILLTDLLLEDAAVHYAVQPIAIASEPMLFLVQSGESVYEVLPDTILVEVVFQGVLRTEEQFPVSWDTSEETTSNAIADRRRTNVSGHLDGVLLYRSLHCTLAFLEQPITFTEVSAKSSKQWVMLWAEFTQPTFPMAVEAEYSFDEEEWFAAKADFTQSETTSSFSLYFSDPSIAEEGESVWNRTQQPLVYLRLHWLDAEADDVMYSDILTIDGTTLDIASSPGGNRGGGTGLVPPELPPLLGGENERPDSGGNGNDGESTTPPAVQPEPPNTNVSDKVDKPQSLTPTPLEEQDPPSNITLPPLETTGESEQRIPPTDTASTSSPPTPSEAPAIASETETTSVPPTKAPSVQASETNTLPRKSTVVAIPKESDIPTAKAPQITDEPKQPPLQKSLTSVHTKVPAMADEDSERTSVDSVASPTKAAAQIAVGLLATGGIITLTMTWKHWGKSVTRILSSQRAKKE